MEITTVEGQGIPEVKFWHYGPDEAFRLLSLYPDGKVTLDTGRICDEEGYSQRVDIIEHRGTDLLLTSLSFAKDCDGPLDHETTLVVALDRLAVFQGPDGAPLTPDWVREETIVRDYNAEAAGY